MRKDLTKHREELEQASRSDKDLVARFKASKRVVDILRQPLDNVEVIFAAEVGGNASAGSPVANLIDADTGFEEIGDQVLIERLDSLVQRVRLLKKERSDVLQDLKTKVFPTLY